MNLMTSYSLLLYYKRINEIELVDYYTQRCLLIAQEIVSDNDETVVGRLLALPSKMAQMVEGKYTFDSDLLVHIIHMALANSTTENKQCQPA